MGIEQRLQEQKLKRLKQVARQLGARGYSKLRVQELIDYMVAHYSEHEITAILDKPAPQKEPVPHQPGESAKKLPWGKRNKKNRIIKIIGILGSLASLIGIIIGIVFFFESQKGSEKQAKELTQVKQEITVLRENDETRKEKLDELKRSVDKLCSSDPREKKEAGEELEKGNPETIRQLLLRDIKAECGKDEEKYYLLGNTYYASKQPDYKKALENYLQASQMDPDNTTYLNSIGLAFDKLAQHKKAIQYYEKALASDRKTYGDEHPDVAIDWNNLGLAWQALGEYKKAIEYYEKALASDRKTYGDEHPQVATY